MTDAVQSVGVIAAGLVMQFTGWYTVDPVASIAIAAMVAYSGIKISIEATHVLIEGTPTGVDLGEVAELMQATPGVREITDLHAWSLTTGYNALTAHVITDPSADDASYDAVRCRLLERLKERFPLQHVTLQLEKECELCGTSCCDWLDSDSGEDVAGAD
jgi:cobalt-zinc-cadmium efflux system protein